MRVSGLGGGLRWRERREVLERLLPNLRSVKDDFDSKKFNGGGGAYHEPVQEEHRFPLRIPVLPERQHAAIWEVQLRRASE